MWKGSGEIAIAWRLWRIASSWAVKIDDMFLHWQRVDMVTNCVRKINLGFALGAVFLDSMGLAT